MENSNMYQPMFQPAVQSLVTLCGGDFFQTFGYSPDKIIGCGMSSTVVTARPPSSHKDKMEVVKMILKEFQSATYIKKFYFETEVSILSKLKHKHVVEMIMACESPGNYIITMPYYSRGCLTSHLPYMTYKDTDKFFLQLTSAIIYLHNNAIAHRDIKPDNILISSDGDAVLSDFGLACVVTSKQMTLKHHVGTEAYSAPEMRHGFFNDKIDYYKFDMYSLGLVLWCMVVRDEAKEWQSDHIERLGMKRINPGSYRHIIGGLIADSPEERWDSNQLASILWDTWSSMGHDLTQYFDYCEDPTQTHPNEGVHYGKDLGVSSIPVSGQDYHQYTIGTKRFSIGLWTFSQQPFLPCASQHPTDCSLH